MNSIIKITKSTYALLLFVSICINSCSFQKLGNDIGKGLGQGVSSKTDTIGRSLVAGLRDELSSDETKAKLVKFIDSVLTPLTVSLKKTTGSVRDSIINHNTLIWADSLTEALTGQHLNANMKTLQATLIGKTKTDVIQIRNAFRELLADILSDTTKRKLGLIRDELLGPKTNAAITKIVDTAVVHLVDSSLARLAAKYRTDFGPEIKDNLSFIHKNATELLITLGCIAALIIFLVWQNRKKYLQMVTLLTKQINDIPDQHVYDTVTQKIKSEAITTGLEPDLRDILNKNGLLGRKA